MKHPKEGYLLKPMPKLDACGNGMRVRVGDIRIHGHLEFN
jgi:hypothetical protein